MIGCGRGPEDTRAASRPHVVVIRDTPMGGSLIMSSVARPPVLGAGIILLLLLAAAPLPVGDSIALSVPSIISISPTMNALDVQRNAQGVVQFNEHMDHSSFNSLSVRVVGERFGPYPGTISFFESPTGSVVTYIPAASFSIGE